MIDRQVQHPQASPARRLIEDLPLFSAAARAPAPPRPDAAFAAVRDALSALNPDDLSPREALEALYRLKSLAAKGEG
jgi:DNA mismatch repair protein MutS